MRCRRRLSRSRVFRRLQPPAGGGGLEISFHADPYVYDGQFANNSWLQELPNPVTRLTWDNAVLVSTATAQKLNLQVEDRVELKYQGHTVKGAVWIQPGQPNDSIAVHVGFGRTHSGRAGNGAGFNAYRIRTSEQPELGRRSRTQEVERDVQAGFGAEAFHDRSAGARRTRRGAVGNGRGISRRIPSSRAR